MHADKASDLSVTKCFAAQRMCSIHEQNAQVHFHAGRLELDIVWERVSAASAVQAEPLNPGSTCAWRMHVIDPAHAQTYGLSAFSLSVSPPLMSFSAEPSGAEASKNDPSQAALQPCKQTWDRWGIQCKDDSCKLIEA